MSYELKGKIHHIGDTEQKGNFRSRNLVVNTGGQYPQLILVQFVQDKVDLLDRYGEGDDVTVKFDIRGKEWQGKYFTNLQAWKIE